MALAADRIRWTLVLAAGLIGFGVTGESFASPRFAAGQADHEEITEVERRTQELCSRLNCLCGCRAQISNCPHVQCGFAVRGTGERPGAREQVRLMVARGLSDEDILAFMVEDYGPKILSTPPAEGTNVGAYLLPVLFVVGGGIGAFFLLRRWKRRGAAEASARPERKATASQDEVDERVEAHLANLD